MTSPERDDEELLLLARGGVSEAFDALVRRHQARALRVAQKFLGHPTLAKDAVQSTFVELYRYLPRYRSRGAFRCLLHRILINQCRMASRSRQNEGRAHAVLAREEPTPSNRSAEDQVLARERKRDVQRALNELSPKIRSVIVLRFGGDLSLEEISQTLELPLGTVKSRLFAGLAKLRADLEDVP